MMMEPKEKEQLLAVENAFDDYFEKETIKPCDGKLGICPIIKKYKKQKQRADDYEKLLVRFYIHQNKLPQYSFSDQDLLTETKNTLQKHKGGDE